MKIDESLVGFDIGTYSAVLEAGRLSFYANVIGETNPIYTNAAAARRAGYRDIAALPTFLFGLPLEAPGSMDWLTDLGVELKDAVQSQQDFEYHDVACAGDHLIFCGHISDVAFVPKKSMIFLTRTINVTSQSERPVATMRDTLAILTKHGDHHA